MTIVQLTTLPESVQFCHSATVHKHLKMICAVLVKRNGALVHTGKKDHVHMGTKVVAVSVNRGGTGKTMITRSLATAAAAAGLSVLILDMDTQQNSTSWRKRRPQELTLPLVQFTTENDLEETLQRARAADCDLVVIDTPPGRSTEAAAAVEAADLVLVPCTPEVESFEGLPRTARLAKSNGTPAVVVPNMVNPTSLSEDQAIRGVAEAHGLKSVPVTFHRFNVHREGSLRGQTAREIQPDSKAAAEIDGLWNWICAELQLTTNAVVHKVA